jgi:hypothetical protein
MFSQERGDHTPPLKMGITAMQQDDTGLANITPSHIVNPTAINNNITRLAGCI